MKLDIKAMRLNTYDFVYMCILIPKTYTRKKNNKLSITAKIGDY